MKKTLLAFGFLGFGVITSLTTYILAQTRAPEIPPIATDVTAEDIVKFIDNLPKDRVSDRPIRSVEVTGDYRVGVYGVFRPKEFEPNTLQKKIMVLISG